jgi:Ferritin-like
VPDFPGPPPEPGEAGDLTDTSAGPGRKPSDAWTAVRLLTEGAQVMLTLKRQGIAARMQLNADRARYLDDNGTLSAAFLPGELTQSLCSPWTHDFRDCGCYYWASNHPDIAQPVTPSAQVSGPQWNSSVNWQRGSRALSTTPPAPATSNNRSETLSELRHYEINNRWEELHFVVGRREIAAPFAAKQIRGVPLAGMEELLAQLHYAAGVEIAVAQEYLAAAYSLKSDDDPSVLGEAELLDDIRSTRSELMRIAIGEMRHTRIVNDVLRSLMTPGAFVPALRVASMVPSGALGAPRLVEIRAATRAAIDDFIQIEAPSAAVDGLYIRILATLEDPPSDDIRQAATDELRQAVRSIIAEGEDHYQTFLDIREWLSHHAETDYLRSAPMVRSPAALDENKILQTAYGNMLMQLHSGYLKGRFLGATEINSARAAMVGLQGIEGAAAAVAAKGFLVAFDPPQGFEPLPPPAIA